MSREPHEKLEVVRHSAAHVMAAAVCRLYDEVRFDIGPATEQGFYYDFDLPERITSDDFPRIEEEMRKIVGEDHPFERVEMSREEAVEWLEQRNQTYKLERLAEIPEGETITFYRTGDFMDLCRGPHVESTGKISAFKLLSVAGSYFHGIETNPMLQRVYGTAFTNPKELRKHLQQLEEARKRDHRRLGRDLDLFSIREDVGPGLVHWHPRGARIRVLIENFWRDEHFRNGYELLFTPHIGKANLWETSGHLGFYHESMYAPMEIDGQEYYIKPMNCPFHIAVYSSQTRSYRDLPLRWAELGTVYRYEKAGALHGLLRVRGFTQDDAHIFCTPDQVEDEIREVLRFSTAIWKTFGFEDIRAYLSTRPEKAVGDPARWEQSTAALERAVEAEELPVERDEGGGAFYGPKIDLKVRDAIGREWQMSTIQFDLNLPERFDINFVGSDGREHRPYMIHRALFGSLERFFGILTEHYGGAFPVWLAPEQARILPITDRQLPYANEVAAAFRREDVRVTVDAQQEKMGAKIRRAQLGKVPYMLVVGEQEEEAGAVAVRSRSGGREGQVPWRDCLDRIRAEAAERR
ncbi:threonine--tRNA ligase [Kiritimatiella glycovorans]|uniref:Threonine--tRNA ligase n=1 Tax=Kiritimatiella glycovorans TaxID=1307763 RepID=A0A0G3ENE0_9BACT|nr:threonine--tRNA ligase [Kiritimatiella glycovorans]AKJ65664.1 Threonine--tRNA ligase [Kiritimatiella glycovorans]